MKSSLRSIFLNLTFTLVGILLLYWVLRDKQLGQIWAELSSFNYWWLILANVTALITYYNRAARWKMQLETLGYRPRIWTAFHAISISYLASLIVARLSELVRCWSLKRTDNVPVDISLGSVISERVIDLLIFFCILALGLLIKIDLILPWLKEGLAWPKLAMGNTAYLVLGAMTVGCISIGIWLMKNQVLRQKITNFLQGIRKGIETVRHLKNPIKFWLHTACIWVIYYLNFQIGLLAMTNTIGPADGFFLFSISTLGMAAPTQGGMGTFHWLVNEGLNAIQIDPTRAIAWVFLFHGIGMLFKLSLGLISYLAVLWMNKRSN